MSSTYPDSVTDRRARLDALVEHNRAAEQRLRVDMARSMRRALDRKEVSGTQMAVDLGLSRWRLYQVMALGKPEPAAENGDQSVGDAGPVARDKRIAKRDGSKR